VDIVLFGQGKAGSGWAERTAHKLLTTRRVYHEWYALTEPEALALHGAIAGEALADDV
jgi:hypothetical protein